MWKTLNREYLEEKYVEADEALADYEKCRRIPMQSMRDYLMALRASRVRMEKEDPGSRVSDLSYARRMLRRSGLTRMEQRQVLGTAGAAWDADSIERSLIMMYGDAHQDDRSRVKSFDGQGPRSNRSVSSASSGFSRGRQSSRGSSFRGGRGFRGTFAAGISEADELGFSEESDAEEQLPTSRSPQRADDGSQGTPAASTALHVDDEHEEEEDSRLLLESDDNLSDLPDKEEELLEVYFQGLRAKKKLKSPAKRDKSKSTCKDCKGKGHWAGDAECPMVKSGAKPLFQPSPAKKVFGKTPRVAAVVDLQPVQFDDLDSDDEQTGLFAPEPLALCDGSEAPIDDPLIEEIARRRRELQRLEAAVQQQVISVLDPPVSGSLPGAGPTQTTILEREPSVDSWEHVAPQAQVATSSAEGEEVQPPSTPQLHSCVSTPRVFTTPLEGQSPAGPGEASPRARGRTFSPAPRNRSSSVKRYGKPHRPKSQEPPGDFASRVRAAGVAAAASANASVDADMPPALPSFGTPEGEFVCKS